MALKRFCIPCALALLCPSDLFSQGLPQQSPRISSYAMDVELLPAEKAVAGTQEIKWRNATAAPTDELRFHLYLNAFRDRHSTFMREAGPELADRWREDERGGITVRSIRLVEGDTETPLEMAFISPDDDNSDDATVLRVALPRPVGPGESVTVRTDFESHLPKAYIRTGWVPGGGFFCTHWYPILGVLEDDGNGGNRWNCHQFHAFTEFFADFSTYRVTLTLPSDYVVGATGVKTGTTGSGTRDTHVFEAEDVHNFAFVADPNFVQHSTSFGPLSAAQDPSGVCQTVAKELGVEVSTFDLPSVEIKLLLRPEHDTETQRQRHLDAVEAALEFYGLRFGAYPYPVVTAVDPGRDVVRGNLGGGMEYPMLFTCGTQLFLHPRQLLPERLTIHEFGHQYWYGLSANNEFEEPWLDEGINTYSEGRAQWLGYFAGGLRHGNANMRPVEVNNFGLLPLRVSRGPLLDVDALKPRWRLPGLGLAVASIPRPARDAVEGTLNRVQFDGRWMPESPLLDLMRTQPTASWFQAVPFESAWDDRQTMLEGDNPDPMVRIGWEFIDRESYSVNSYERPATVLRTLERMVGKTNWWTFMREFHARARFGHPTTDDFTALLEQRCGQRAANFFRHAIVAQAVLDYGVHAVRQSSDGRGRREAIVRRYGSLTAAVRVRFAFESGQPEYRTIAADDPETVFRFVFDPDPPGQERGRLTEVWVDPPELPADQEARAWPAGIYLLDQNLLNNAWRLEADSSPALHRALRSLLQVQSELSFSGLIG